MDRLNTSEEHVKREAATTYGGFYAIKWHAHSYDVTFGRYHIV